MFSTFLALLCIGACSDKEDGIDPSASLEIYGRQYQLAGGVIWENNPNAVVAREPYIFKDTYVNAGGEEVTDEVVGFTAGTETRTTGNFLLSLYETGLVYNAALQTSVGKAACICFHLSSVDTKQIKPGKYTYEAGKKENTFIAYASSNYDAEKSVTPAAITAGEVYVEQNGGEYSVKFNCKTSFEGEIKGEYRGEMYQVKVPQQPSAYYQNITLAGLLDTVVTTESWFGDEPEIYVTADVSNGAAFFSTSSGTTKYARDGGKELSDIALVWDKQRKAFYFESPIRMRSLLWHDSKYDFPCHTTYMKAPDSFSDDDFDNFEQTGFTFELRDEKVWVNTDNFKTTYLFFRAGNGTKGVIRVRGFAPPAEKTSEGWGGWLVTTAPVNPVLYIDVKCPASFVDPKIR